MSTHADAVREAERAVVEAAKGIAAAFHEVGPEGRFPSALADFTAVVDALLELEAETCPTCGGTGTVEFHEDVRGRGACPAGCDNGRRRDA